MRSCDLVIGAFWLSSPGEFSDVEIDTTTPEPAASWITTDGAEVFPASMLNDTQPNGFTAGTAGTEAINRQYKMMMASIPMLDQPDKSVSEDGIRGNDVTVRIPSVPRSLNVGLRLSDEVPNDDSYEQTWNALKRLAKVKPLIYVMHRSFAFRGYISSAPALFLGEIFESSVIPFVFRIDTMYYPQVALGQKQYTLFSF